jgi:hypothetical protein
MFDQLGVPVALRSPSRRIGHEDIPAGVRRYQSQTRRAERHHPYSLAVSPDGRAVRSSGLVSDDANQDPPQGRLTLQSSEFTR